MMSKNHPVYTREPSAVGTHVLCNFDAQRCTFDRRASTDGLGNFEARRNSPPKDRNFRIAQRSPLKLSTHVCSPLLLSPPPPHDRAPPSPSTADLNRAKMCMISVALAGIVSASGGSVPCAATGATVTVQFNGMVTGATVDGGVATYNGGEVVFTVGDLEATPTNFEVSLDWCGQPAGGEIVASVSYADDEGNTPDLSSLEGSAVVPTCGKHARGTVESLMIIGVHVASGALTRMCTS